MEEVKLTAESEELVGRISKAIIDALMPTIEELVAKVDELEWRVMELEKGDVN